MLSIKNNCINKQCINAFFFQKINSEKILVKQQNSNASMNSKVMENKKITQERSLTYRMRDQKENNHSRKENFSDNDLSIITSSTENMLINFVEYVTLVDVDKNVITTSNEKFLETKEVKKLKLISI